MFQTIWNVLAKKHFSTVAAWFDPPCHEQRTARNEEDSRCRFSFLLPYRATRGFNNDLQNYF